MPDEVGLLHATTRASDEPLDLLALARACPGMPLFYWEHPARGEAMLALGVAREVQTSGPDRFARASAAALAILASVTADADARATLRCVGGFAFGDRRVPGALGREFPPARLVVPRRIWIRAGGRTRYTEIVDEGVRSPTAPIAVGDAAPAPLRLHAVPFADDERRAWRRRVAQARALIAAGEIRKVVLARQQHLVAEGRIDPATILACARAARPTCFTTWLRGRDGTSLVASTPELLVRRSGRVVTASALAGSAPRRSDPVADARAAAELLVCPKNGREHAIVVAAVRAALTAVADEVGTPAAPAVWSLPEAHHLATPVSGRLRTPLSVLDVGGMLHPTPAVCGAPRAAARALIERDEPDRGWYTGALGWIDAAGDGELAVALRSALVAGRRVTLWAGAGIVEGSDADAELAETAAKMRALVGPFVVPSSALAEAVPPTPQAYDATAPVVS